MSIEIKVPVLPESVSDATVVAWHKQPGDSVSEGENLLDLETDKVVLEVPAPQDGVLESIVEAEGAVVVTDQVLATIKEGSVAAVEENSSPAVASEEVASTDNLSPAVRRLVAEHKIDIAQVQGSGKGGRIIKEDVEKLIAQKNNAAPKAPATAASNEVVLPTGARVEERVPMSRLRTRIAERLVEVKQNTAMLTTFNEVNMQPIMQLRAKYKDRFADRHGVKLGFMSFFTKAAVEALKRFPAVNAYIDGQDILYHAYQDVGIAVFYRAWFSRSSLTQC